MVGRNVISASKEEEEDDSSLTVYYCLCGEFLMVSQTPLAALPRRPVDGALALRNTGPAKVIYKLNAEPHDTSSRGVLVRRSGAANVGSDENHLDGTAATTTGGGGEYELQKKLCCPRCRLNVAYTVTSQDATVHYKPDVTFLLPGAMTDAQGKLPAGALGDDKDAMQ